MEFTIKTVHSNDYQQIDSIIKQAFEQSDLDYNVEVEIVHSLRKLADYDLQLEIGAYYNDTLIGMGLLSSGYIKKENQILKGMILAPLAVDPSFQKQGAGKQIISQLEKRAAELEIPFIHLVGHPEYYQKLGYSPISNWNLISVLTGPSDAFMLKKLIDNSLANSKTGKYTTTVFLSHNYV